MAFAISVPLAEASEEHFFQTVLPDSPEFIQTQLPDPPESTKGLK